MTPEIHINLMQETETSEFKSVGTMNVPALPRVGDYVKNTRTGIKGVVREVQFIYGGVCTITVLLSK